MKDNRVALAFSEKAVGNGQSGGCFWSTAESPPCGRVTISGRLTMVPEENKTQALRYLYARHPEMKGWNKAHADFAPFWLAPENITDFFVINFFGGAKHPTVSEYLQAPWAKQLNSGSLNLHPRPDYKNVASYTRWLVHESDYAIVTTHDGGDVFANVMSISDGFGYDDSTGVIYTFLPGEDATYQQLMKDNRVALAFSEKAVGNGQSGGCFWSTAESPPCGRVTISGRLTMVPEENKTQALRYLYARHPEMKGWNKAHADFAPFWLAPENITDFFVINFFGGAKHPTVSEYLQAPWYQGSTCPAIQADDSEVPLVAAPSPSEAIEDVDAVAREYLWGVGEFPGEDGKVLEEDGKVHQKDVKVPEEDGNVLVEQHRPGVLTLKLRLRKD